MRKPSSWTQAETPSPRALLAEQSQFVLRVDSPCAVISAEEFAVRTEPCQPESFGVGFSVDEQQVRLDVAFAIARPIAGEIMIAMPRLQRLIVRKNQENRQQNLVECYAVAASGLSLVVSFECR